MFTLCLAASLPTGHLPTGQVAPKHLRGFTWKPAAGATAWVRPGQPGAWRLLDHLRKHVPVSPV